MLKDVACYLCHRDLNNYPYVVAICHSKSVKMIEVCFSQMFHSTYLASHAEVLRALSRIPLPQTSVKDKRVTNPKNDCEEAVRIKLLSGIIGVSVLARCLH